MDTAADLIVAADCKRLQILVVAAEEGGQPAAAVVEEPGTAVVEEPGTAAVGELVLGVVQQVRGSLQLMQSAWTHQRSH